MMSIDDGSVLRPRNIVVIWQVLVILGNGEITGVRRHGVSIGRVVSVTREGIWSWVSRHRKGRLVRDLVREGGWVGIVIVGMGGPFEYQLDVVHRNNGPEVI